MPKIVRAHIVFYASREAIDGFVTGYGLMYGHSPILRECVRKCVPAQTGLSSTAVQGDTHVLYHSSPRFVEGAEIAEEIVRVLNTASDMKISCEFALVDEGSNQVLDHTWTGNHPRFLCLKPVFSPGGDAEDAQHNHLFF